MNNNDNIDDNKTKEVNKLIKLSKETYTAKNSFNRLIPNAPTFAFDSLTKNGPSFKLSSAFADATLKGVSAFSNRMITETTPSVNSILKDVANAYRKIISSAIELLNTKNNSYFISLFEAIEEAIKNPNSKINWMNYCNKLNEFFWIMPYKLTTEELFEKLKVITSEKEFDKYIANYFNNKIVKLLINDIKNMQKNNNQKILINQIIAAYDKRSYALVNIGLMSMIDNALSFFLVDKGCPSRINMFKPIINDLDFDSDIVINVMMIDSTINKLYENVEFNHSIKIKTNKKVRRNPMAHGKAYSNRKIDAIMLMNTLYYLLIIQEKLFKYKNSLLRNSKQKEFYIATKKQKQEARKKIKKISF